MSGIMEFDEKDSNLVETDERDEQPHIGLCEAAAREVALLCEDSLHLPPPCDAVHWRATLCTHIHICTVFKGNYTCRRYSWMYMVHMVRGPYCSTCIQASPVQMGR